MAEQKTAVLTTVFSEVLANLAFMFTDEEPQAHSPDDEWLETTISYRGSASGTLRLYCTKQFSTVLASSLLGTEPDDQEAHAQADDAVKEFMNIVCGQLITRAHGTKDVFNLSIPEVRGLNGPPDLDDATQTSRLFVDGHCVQLSYTQDVHDAIV